MAEMVVEFQVWVTKGKICYEVLHIVYIMAHYILKYFSACLPIYLSVFVFQKIWSFIWNVRTISDQT